MLKYHEYIETIANSTMYSQGYRGGKSHFTGKGPQPTKTIKNSNFFILGRKANC